MQFTTEVDNKPTQIAGNLGRTTHNGRNGALGRLFFGSTPRRLSEAANSPRASASQNERKSANSSHGNRPTTDSFNSSF